jgi:hypothetical protein
VQAAAVVLLDLGEPQACRYERRSTATRQADRIEESTRESQSRSPRAELANAEAQLVAQHGIGPLRQLAIKLTGTQPGTDAQPEAAEQRTSGSSGQAPILQPPPPADPGGLHRRAGPLGMPCTVPSRREAPMHRAGRPAGHAARPVGRRCLWKERNSLRGPRPSPAAHRATTGATVDRPSRQARPQRANAAATSCSAPISRTSCSRALPSTRGHEGPSECPRLRRSTIPAEASAAS